MFWKWQKMGIAYKGELMFSLSEKICAFLLINTINVAFI